MVCGGDAQLVVSDLQGHFGDEEVAVRDLGGLWALCGGGEGLAVDGDGDAGLGSAVQSFYCIIDHAAYVDAAVAGDGFVFRRFDAQDGGGLIDADCDGAAGDAALGVRCHGGDHVGAFAQEEAREAER